jgi:hypothetical protein
MPTTVDPLADIFGEHPCVLVSFQARIDAKPQVVVLGCRILRPGNEREPRANEVLLDDADGLDLKTLCRCDLLFTGRPAWGAAAEWWRPPVARKSPGESSRAWPSPDCR